MKNTIIMNRRNNNSKLETAKSIATSVGEGLGIAAMIGLSFAAAYAEVEADEAAERRLYELDRSYYSLKKEIDEMSISKYPYGYYSSIHNDFDSIESRYRRVRNMINWHGLKNETIREIQNRYGYSFLNRLESDISSLSIRIH